MMKKLNLGGLAVSAKSEKPVHPTVDVTNNTLKGLLSQFVLLSPQFKTMEANMKSIKAQQGPLIRGLYFSRFAGVSPESSTMLTMIDGKKVKLIVKNKYTTTQADDEGLIAALGEEAVGKHFKQATVISLNLDDCPADKAETFAQRVIALAQELGVTDCVSAKQCIQPVAGFHEARTTILTPEQNLAVDAILPVTAYAQL